ncbi:CUB domain-containing protein [Camponotus japonicus]
MRYETALYLLSLLILSLNDPSWASAEIRGCNRTIRNSVGWIRWTGRMGRCTVRIRAPIRDPQVIEVKVRRLQVGFLKEARCEGAYFQFSDSADDPDDETGRYCGHVTGNVTRLFLRRGPDLSITLSSDAHFASANPVIFSAQFSILPARLAVERHRGYSASSSPTCPMECTVRNERRSCRLTSPGYPSVYPRGIRCRIALESSAGRFRIGGQPEDLFDLMNYSDQESCQIEDCEDSIESEGFARSSFSALARVARSRYRFLEDESIIRDDRSRKEHDCRTRRGAETNRQLTRRRHYEKKATRWYGDRQYHHKEPNRPGTSEPSRLRIKSMRSKITRQDQRRVAPNRYLNGDSERSNETFGSTTIPKYKYPGEDRSSENVTCDGGDYLALLENVNGKVLEISKFCGSGRVPRIYSRGRNVILEFFARKDGTVTHDGFQVTLQEERVSQETKHARCEFVYRSSRRNSRENIRSPRSWYPPNTVCTYKFLGRTTERVSVHIKILRNELEHEKSETKRNFSLNYCPGNEITVYNGGQVNGSFLMWSYCDVSHWDINNIQVPLTSSGNELLIQYYSAKGSYDGQGFTYAVSYRFVKKEQNYTGIKRKYKSISLRPVNLSTLNLNDTDADYECDNRIGTFKNWFAVLMVFGVVSFVGAVVTIVTLTAKCLKIRSAEKKLLQNTKQ